MRATFYERTHPLEWVEWVLDSYDEVIEGNGHMRYKDHKLKYMYPPLHYLKLKSTIKGVLTECMAEASAQLCT